MNSITIYQYLRFIRCSLQYTFSVLFLVFSRPFFHLVLFLFSLNFISIVIVCRSENNISDVIVWYTFEARSMRISKHIYHVRNLEADDLMARRQMESAIFV